MYVSTKTCVGNTVTRSGNVMYCVLDALDVHSPSPTPGRDYSYQSNLIIYHIVALGLGCGLRGWASAKASRQSNDRLEFLKGCPVVI